MKPILAIAALCAASSPGAAFAEIPQPVQDMIDAAIASKQDKDVATVIKLAKSTNPDDADALDAIHAQYKTERTAEKLAAKEAKYANAHLLDNWTGKGEIGAYRSTGNSSNTGVTGRLELEKDSRDWRHKLHFAADYQRSNGLTSRERYMAGYEPNYKFSKRGFVYGLAQFERDRFQGFSARYTASGGIGYSVIDNDNMSLDMKAGPAYRRTEFTAGNTDSSIAGLAAADFDWKIAEKIKLTEDASAYIGPAIAAFRRQRVWRPRSSDRCRPACPIR